MGAIIKSGTSIEELADKVFALFEARGYKLEDGTKLQGVYANGSAALRALLGGLVKRNKFSVKIEQTTEGDCVIDFDKAMSGALGGAIGVAKLNKEFKQVSEMLSDL